MNARTLTAAFLLCVLSLIACAQSPEAKKAKHLERGLAYYEKAMYPEAVVEFKNVVQLDPKDPDGHYRLALTYLKLKSLQDLQAAFRELRSVVELAPGNRDAQLKLAELYLIAQQPAESNRGRSQKRSHLHRTGAGLRPEERHELRGSDAAQSCDSRPQLN